MTSARAETEVARLRHFFRLLPAVPEVLEIWQAMVVSHGISGKQAHDAHLVAVMQVYGVGSILTFNVGHFRRYERLSLLDPAQY